MKEIDAKGKPIGRVATEAAMALMGKDRPDYVPNVIQTEGVHIINASSVSLTEKKKSEKQYSRYTGYPGGLRFEPLGKVIKKHGYAEVFQRAVKGMLPANKLRSEMLKKLTVSE
jgi:large subunit ribosomal protein L13